jgi:hypothetical protein
VSVVEPPQPVEPPGPSFSRDAWRAVRISWWIVSIVVALGFAAPLILPEASILEISEALKSPSHSPDACALCGMTRAGLILFRGDLRTALALHPFSLVAFCAVTLNSFAAGASIVGAVRVPAKPEPRSSPTRSGDQPCKS